MTRKIKTVTRNFIVGVLFSTVRRAPPPPGMKRFLGFLKWMQTSVETIKTCVLDIKRLRERELWKLEVVENDDSCVEIVCDAASLFDCGRLLKKTSGSTAT